MTSSASAIHYFERSSRPVQLLIALGAVFALGVLDYLSGHEAFFAVFYLFPIAFVAWHVGWRWAMAYSVLSAAVWLGANIAAGEVHTRTWIFAWNTFTRFAVFYIVASLLTALRAAHDHERRLARTDHLTGAENRRSFYDLAERERERCRRYRRPFTVVYADVDNFKSVNDTLGHSTGDALLREVTSVARKALRSIDVVARLGGDEFALLLPETGPDAGRQVAERVGAALDEAMARHRWPVSFSVGVVTCLEAPATLDELLSAADRLMYAVKGEGKRGLRHEVVGADPGIAAGVRGLPMSAAE